MVDDNRRQNGLIAVGLRILRFTSVDVYKGAATVALQVRHALASNA
jgi:very-short-patch-repair endonuclease